MLGALADLTLGLSGPRLALSVHECVDRVTGKHSDRVQFQKLFQDASQRKSDIVLNSSIRRIRATLG